MALVPYQEKTRSDLILLDLNLPKKDGREVLAEIKTHAQFKTISVMVLTSSQADEDIAKAYEYHTNCYVTKPIDLEQFTKMIKALDEFWFTLVKFPPKQ